MIRFEVDFERKVSLGRKTSGGRGGKKGIEMVIPTSSVLS